MKISNSKKQLAKIIHENGGWREGAEFTAQDGDGTGSIDFFKSKPRLYRGDIFWKGDYYCDDRIDRTEVTIKNWHQTILSREEYFHLYPSPDADGWIEWKGGECPVDGNEIIDIRYPESREEFGAKAKFRRWFHGGDKGDIIAYRLHKTNLAETKYCESVMRSIPEPEIHSKNTALTQVDDINVVELKPTIEKLAADYRNAKDFADRKQEEAKTAKADAKAKLAELVAAGKALGLALSVAGAESEPEMVITDWRDLRVGDVIELTGSKNPCWKEHFRSEMTVREVYQDQGDIDDQVDLIGESGCWSLGGNTTWRFIRRP